MLNYIKLLPNKVKRNVRSSANLGQHYRSSESTMFYQNQIMNNNNIIIIMNNSLLREHILIGICIYYTFIITRIIIYRTAWMVVVVSNVLNCYEHAPCLVWKQLSPIATILSVSNIWVRTIFEFYKLQVAVRYLGFFSEFNLSKSNFQRVNTKWAT